MFVFHEGLPFFLPQLNLIEKLSVNDSIMSVRSYSKFSSLVPSVRQRQSGGLLPWVSFFVLFCS